MAQCDQQRLDIVEFGQNDGPCVSHIVGVADMGKCRDGRPGSGLRRCTPGRAPGVDVITVLRDVLRFRCACIFFPQAFSCWKAS